MIIDLYANSSRGVLDHNEDMILIGDDLVRDQGVGRRVTVDLATEKLVLAVADGLGGAQAGAVASEMALTRIKEVVNRMPADLEPDEVAEVLRTWAAETHTALRTSSVNVPERQAMGTTVVGLLLCNGRAYRFHSGDSRLYRMRQGNLERLTADHSLRQESGNAAVPSNLLTNSLGGGDSSWLEFQELTGGLEEHDRFLLCSDGLHDSVPDRVIGTALVAELEIAVLTLAKAAMTAGGRDNCSILLLDVNSIASPDAGTVTSGATAEAASEVDQAHLDAGRIPGREESNERSE